MFSRWLRKPVPDIDYKTSTECKDQVVQTFNKKLADIDEIIKGLQPDGHRKTNH